MSITITPRWSQDDVDQVVEAALAEMRVPDVDIIPAPPVPAFIVAHTTPGHFEVRAAGGCKSVDGIDYDDFTSAKATRDRLNAPAVTA